MNWELWTIYILPTDTCYGIACALDDKASYEKIYKIKKRSHSKPLAIMVPNFQWLEKNTDLTDEQIAFLRKYDRPFTVLTDSSPIRLFLEYADENENHFINKDIYEFISFRVANTDITQDIVSRVGPIWLTSANLTWEWEIYTPEEIEEEFEYYLENGSVELLWNQHLDEDTPPSDVFYFTGEGVEIEYVRKG
jgi:tRNA A37 threonylcarbamoyladenosine synthetase subunit TsaC/SUA5/YrdC